MQNGKMTVLLNRLRDAQNQFSEGKALSDIEIQKNSLRDIFNLYVEMSKVSESVEMVESYREKANFIAKKIMELENRMNLDPNQKVEVDNDITKSNLETFKDVIGMDDVKTEITKMVLDPIRFKAYYQNFSRVVKSGGGIILTGDPGNGKTYFARAIAGELNANFFKSVKLGEVLSNSPGAPEKYIAALFSEANSHQLSVIFFDEFDAIAAKRGDSDNAKSIDNKLVDALLQQMDGFTKDNDHTLLLIAATNRVDLLDEAITRPGRFDKVFEVKKPNAEARMLKLKMEFDKISHKIEDLSPIVIQTEGFSFADMQYIIVDACRNAIRQAINERRDPKDVVVELDHIVASIQELKQTYLVKGVNL